MLTAFLEDLKKWVATQLDVVGAALVGSYARNAATEASDIDVIILTTAVEKYFLGEQWASLFGQVQKAGVEDWGAVRTLRVSYRDGLEVEFNFSSPAWASVPVDFGTHQVVSDGMKIVFDPQGTLGSLQRAVLSTSAHASGV